MFNRSEIFKAAWANYHRTHANAAAWQIERGIVDGSFSKALKTAWRVAKAKQAADARKQAIEANPTAAAIAHQIDMLQFKSSRIDIAAQRANLTAHLNQLIAA